MKRLVRQIQFSLARMLGYRYIVNLRSKEIHRLDGRPCGRCLHVIRQYKLIREKQLPVWLLSGYNGYRFCMPELDTDGRTADDSEPEIYLV